MKRHLGSHARAKPLVGWRQECSQVPGAKAGRSHKGGVCPGSGVLIPVLSLADKELDRLAQPLAPAFVTPGPALMLKEDVAPLLLRPWQGMAERVLDFSLLPSSENIDLS